MKRFLLAAFLAAAGLCAVKAVPEIKPSFFVEEEQCGKYEYPAQELDYNGRKVRMDAVVVYKASEDGKGYDFINLTLRFSPVGSVGFPVYMADSISKYSRCNTVVERVEYDLKKKTAKFNGKACMYAVAFSDYAHNDNAKAVARYSVWFNAIAPEKNSIACKLVSEAWDEPGDIVAVKTQPEMARWSDWSIRLHETGLRQLRGNPGCYPGYLKAYFRLFQPCKYEKGDGMKKGNVLFADRLALSFQMGRIDYDEKHGGKDIDSRSLFPILGARGSEPIYEPYAVGREGSREVIAESTAPLHDMPLKGIGNPEAVDYRVYAKGAYKKLRGAYMDAEVTEGLYIKEAAFTCLFHNYGYPPVSGLY